MAYPTEATLLSLSTNAALSGAPQAAKDTYYARAIRAVERYCGQSFDELVTTFQYDGQEARSFILPRRLARLDALVVYGSSLSAASVFISPEGDRLIVNPSLVPGFGSSYYSRALADFQSEPLRFVWGQGNVQVTGLWGWLPAEWAPRLGAITDALMIDMEDQAVADAHQLSPSLSAYRKLGLTDINQGNLHLKTGPQVAISPRAAAQIPPELIWEAHGALA